MIKRETYLLQLRELKDVQIIKVIAGVRRCGKSTLMEHFRNELLSQSVPVSNIQYLTRAIFFIIPTVLI